MSEEYYQSGYTGSQIDHAIGRIVNGELDDLVSGAASAATAAQSALSGVQMAIKNIPEGSTPIVNDLATGGATMALSAEQGKVLWRRGVGANLVRNGYLADPVNQQGQTTYENVVYGVDEWKINVAGSIKEEVVDGGVRFTNMRDSNSWFHQPFEVALPKGTYAISVYTKDVTGDVAVALGGSTTGRLVCSLGLSSRTVNVSEDGLAKIQFTLPPGASITLAAVMLESSTVPSLGYTDTDGTVVLNWRPEFAKELARCRRFFTRILVKSSLSAAALDCATAATASQISMKIELPEAMRVKPAFTISSLDDVYISRTTASAGVQPTSVTLYRRDSENRMFSLTFKASLTAGETYTVGMYVDGYLDFDSRL